MFNFTTTTIINSDKDFKSDKALFSSLSASDKHGRILRVKRDFTLEMPGITKVYKKVASEPVLCELTIDCAELIKAIPSNAIYPVTGRIALYVALEGSEESIFSNDFYQKGHPFSLGFAVPTADVTGAELAANLKRVADRFSVANIGRKVFDVTVKGSEVTLKGTSEYSRFKGIAALIDEGMDELAIATLYAGELENTQKVFTMVNVGKNGFGTYSHLIKDLRLPTAANTNWTALYQAERPVPGALYNQYTVHYIAPSGTNPSMVAVGHETKSKTTHVFWVRQDIAASFEAVLTEVLGSGPVANDRTAIFEEVKEAAAAAAPDKEPEGDETDNG
jgi:hypothetical protein